MSKERPIIFSSEMVRAILDGRKTQDRRVIRWYSSLVKRRVSIHAGWYYEGVFEGRHQWYDSRNGIVWRPPLRQVGDLFWVRETQWRNGGYVATKGSNFENEGKIPSIFMSRWDSRLTLKVLDIRIEQVQSIKEHEVFLEGVERCLDCDAYILAHRKGEWHEQTDDFVRLWDSHNKPKFSWANNPCVRVIDFEAIKTRR